MPAAPLHELVQRLPGRWSKCSTFAMGPHNFPLPSNSPPTQGCSEGPRGAHQSDSDLPQVALSLVVALGGGADGRASHQPPTPEPGTGDSDQETHSPIPGTSGCHPSERVDSKLNDEDLLFLSNHLAKGTLSGYKYAMKRFEEFCNKFNENATTCPPSVLVKFVRHLHESGANYQTINHYRSAISKFHEGFQGQTAGMHPLVKQAMKAAFRLNPPLPKYQHTFDIQNLLNYLKTWPPNENLSFKLLSYKTLILTIYSTLSRVSSIAALGPTVTENRDHVVLHLHYLEK